MKKASIALPFVAFVAYLIKTMIVPASFADSILVLGLISYIILSQLSLKDKTLEKYDAILKELKDVQSGHELRIAALQSSQSALKASVGMRSVHGNKF